MTDATAMSSRPRLRPLALAAILLAAEFAVIGITFKHGIDFRCLDNWPAGACRSASRSLAALYCVIAVLGLYALLRPTLFRDLLAEAGRDARPLGFNVIGFALAMAPLLFMQQGQGAAMMGPAFACWAIGMTLILGGLAGWLAPLRRWRAFLSRAGVTLLVVLAAGALAPVLAVSLQPLWQLGTIADATFRAVTWLVDAMGYDIVADPVLKHIGQGDFVISVAPVCSGIEGIALVTIFVSLYLWLFRTELRFPRALLLYPVGIATSAALNVVRISVLLIIGIEGQPELAVGGFHSHAGWVMFTAVALGLIAAARGIGWFNRHPVTAAASRPLPPLRQDPVAGRILPFAVFMLTAVVAPAISQNPALFYPIRVLLLAAAVALVWPAIRPTIAQLRRVSPLSWIVGAAVGALWVAIPVQAAEAPPYGALSGGLVLLWLVFRGIGTVLLVPLVEELFFRDYLESRIRGAAPDEPAPLWRVILAAVVTAGFFAALHDRWAEALIAGLLFSWVARRSGRIADAVAAHAIANLIVFAAAILTGNLAII
ncbi:exosortase E/protease, VPEID-CTERM system (plasmid) [Paracoccus sp. TK19116]|uniref:Exosortase E/protease, VPEID-CTERM system n=1 Tax=Paracoccus albicereus TaxID=2922394 RepID=A0ABT1MM61_9RHOB|nr:exosortase E/protease, VPEID-CTERM system [Paracoccus albicereus]MCQ0969375.1 exosortase E/protease, VPEID-CTERM system [Paracoccus albicereus]